jgi:hypothetical protein
MKAGDAVDVDCESKKGAKVCRVFSFKWVKIDLGGGAAQWVRTADCTVTAEAVAEEID